MLRGRQDGADVLAIRPRDAGNPTSWAVLNSLDVVLLVRNHDSQKQLTLTQILSTIYRSPRRRTTNVKAQLTSAVELIGQSSSKNPPAWGRRALTEMAIISGRLPTIEWELAGVHGDPCRLVARSCTSTRSSYSHGNFHPFTSGVIVVGGGLASRPLNTCAARIEAAQQKNREG